MIDYNRVPLGVRIAPTCDHVWEGKFEPDEGLGFDVVRLTCTKCAFVDQIYPDTNLLTFCEHAWYYDIEVSQQYDGICREFWRTCSVCNKREEIYFHEANISQDILKVIWEDSI